MNAVLLTHIGGGTAALIAGTAAMVARKGSRPHIRAGQVFVLAMLVLGASATLLDWQKPQPESGLGGILACYFVVTSWVTARRHDGRTGWFEWLAGFVAIAVGAAMMWGAASGAIAPTPAGMGPVYVLAALSLFSGASDLRAAWLRQLRPAQRLSRHLWRMLFALFIATGSFFLGQQDVLPRELRGTVFLYVLGFAPLALLLFWVVRVRCEDSRSPGRI